MKKVIAAVSGGVDSSVAAYLLKDRGFDVTGITMLLTSGGTELGDDAKQVCGRMGIPHFLLDLTHEFRSNVIEAFAKDYIEGLTPNPCIVCNKTIKFSGLCKNAEALGIKSDFFATGHYAKIEYDASSSLYCLKKAKDTSKDQSYFLYFLSQEQLKRTVFPLGALTKTQVREIAEFQGFQNAKKPESQDICFVPDGDYATFIDKITDKKSPCGNFVDETGKILGRHSGITRYTIGQRKGLGIALGKPMYVKAKDKAANTVTLSDEHMLYAKSLIIDDVSFIMFDELKSPKKVKAKIRYNMTERDATVFPFGEVGDKKVLLEFDKPQRAVTPGQAAVFYDGDTVLGGGIIFKTLGGRETF